MSRTRRGLASAALSLTVAACGGSSGDPAEPDASLADAHPSFPCMTDPVPSTAPATIEVSGVANTVGLGGQQPIANATVRAFDAAGTEAGSATSAGDGSYAIALTTGGTPIDGYLQGSAQGQLDTFLYPPNPMFTDTDDASLLFLSSGTFNLLQGFAGVDQDASRGFVAALVIDCAGTPVAGATVTTDPPGTVIYADSGNLPDVDATATSAGGVAFIFNVPVGRATIGATAEGAPFRAHPIEVRATGNQITTTAIAPGPVPQP
jgi:hypothetical protein